MGVLQLLLGLLEFPALGEHASECDGHQSSLRDSMQLESFHQFARLSRSRLGLLQTSLVERNVRQREQHGHPHQGLVNLPHLDEGVEVLEFGVAQLMQETTSRDEWVELSRQTSEIVAACESWKASRRKDIESVRT
jgi:hypothetical protein